jgi:serine protease Do
MRAHPTLLAAGALGVALSGLFLAHVVRAELPLPAITTTGPAPTARDWNVRHTPVVDVVRRVKDAVVNITSERTVRPASAEEMFSITPSQARVNGMGTGIVVDPRGYVVTNQHVVDDVSSLRVRLGDGTTLQARILVRDAESDLALIKINPARPLPVMPLGTAKDLQVGETVVAIGNAYGYDHTVTVGIVSAIGRDVTLNREVRYHALIQTDASINPGNSGGPLINLNGELVGVNVAIRAGAQGIGFAIPVDTMIRVAADMLAQVRGRENVAPLGLVVRDDVTQPASTASPRTFATRTVVIDKVDAGAADKAGLRSGDVVLKVGEVPVASSLDVQRGLLGHEGGQRVDVVVRRDGSQRTIEMALEAGPRLGQRGDGRSAATLASGTATPAGQVWQALGMRLQEMANPAEVARSHPQLHGGLLVGDVRPDSPAAKAGIRSGDVLVGLHQWEMLSLNNVTFVLNHPDRGSFSPLRFYILRGGQVHRGWVQPAD